MSLPRLLLSLIVLMLPLAAEATSAYPHTCGGELEQNVWKLWDDGGRQYARDALVQKRLLQTGDTYALYDLEITYHNLLAMAVRCKRESRLIQFAQDWKPSFQIMQPLPLPSTLKGAAKLLDDAVAEKTLKPSGYRGKAWICRSGQICNAKNRLAGTEVKLVSAQGLGLFASLGNALARSSVSETVASSFVPLTVTAGFDSLHRWAEPSETDRWRVASGMAPQDIKDSQSRWLFTDMDLWQVGIYADLAGILARRPDLQKQIETRHGRYAGSRETLRALLVFFKTRMSFRDIDTARLGRTRTADLDRGYWRLYKDGRYAGYADERPPAHCLKRDDSATLRLDVSPEDITPVASLGWDLSHARRLVHVLDALESNRESIKQVYGLGEKDLPPKGLPRMFSANLLISAWNGDAGKPLFANWLDGANGWYRVGYDNGTARCMVGYPPYGLTDAFPMGGYATWARHHPKLAEITNAIYQQSQSSDAASVAFIRRYYAQLAFRQGDRPSPVQLAGRMMFWPTLVIETRPRQGN